MGDHLQRTALIACLALACLSSSASTAAAASGDQVFRTSVPGVGTVSAAGSTGSAFVVSPGRMLTAAHVLEGARAVSVDVDGRRVRASVERSSARLDLAVLLLADQVGQVLPFRDGLPEVGEEVFAIGAARGDMAITRGVVSRVRLDEDPPHLQTDAAVNPGNSGGPLLDGEGRVVGLVVSKLRDAEGIALAVPASELRAFLDAAASEPDDGIRDPGAGDGSAAPANGQPPGDRPDPRWALLLPLAGVVYLLRARRRDPRIILGPVRTTAERTPQTLPPGAAR